MKAQKLVSLILLIVIAVAWAGLFGWSRLSVPPIPPLAAAGLLQDNPSDPAETVKLVFVHHSTGENWLADDNGQLGITLRDHNYFVSDTNYGWGQVCSGCQGCWAGDRIGDCTDVGHWWEWFRGPNRDTFMSELYTEYGQNSYYSRLPTDPGGENEIIVFKSCFPNSHIDGNPDDPPNPGPNPLRSQSADMGNHNVANVKGIYNDILAYFSSRPEKLFVLIVSPPLVENETDPAHAANARAVANWLYNDWLSGYTLTNVAVYDFYNVLTSNGGSTNTNDLNWPTGNHHRWWEDAEQHLQTEPNNFSAYGSSLWDSHPTAAGGQKASAEFVTMLNVFYHRWQGGTVPPTPTATGSPEPTATHTPSPEPTATGTNSPEPTATATHTPGPTATPTEPPSTPDHWIHLPVVLNAWGALPTRTPIIPSTTPSDTQPAPTATPTDTPPPGQQVIVFQQGVSPDPSYAGTTDTILLSDYYTVNVGGMDYIETFFGEGEEVRRSIVRWDLAGYLPLGSDVLAATVELYRFDGYAENDMPVALYRLTREWVEGSGVTPWPGPGYVADGATWIEAGPGIPWTAPGGDYDPTVVGHATLPAGTGNGWVRWDATAAVAAWVEQGQPNHGLLLRPLSGDYSYHYYHSRDAESVALRPRLVVTYTTGLADAASGTLNAHTGLLEMDLSASTGSTVPLPESVVYR